MAEEKKDSNKNLFEEIVFLLIGLFLLSMLVNRINNYLDAYHYGSIEGIWANIAAYFRYNVWPIVKILASLVSLAAIIGIFYNFMKLREINLKEKETYGLPILPADGTIIEAKNEKWERVIEHINSANPSDWRLAIIEADVMLEDLMRRAGYHGDSIGDMLKSVEKSDFLSVENAWEAHKTRNKIAHQAGDFPLNEREAKRTIALYESVFKEFKII